MTDLDVFLSWVPDEEAMVLWSGPTFSWPLDRLQLERYLTNVHRRYWTGTDEITGAIVGHGSCCSITKRGRVVWASSSSIQAAGERDWGGS